MSLFCDYTVTALSLTTKYLQVGLNVEQKMAIMGRLIDAKLMSDTLGSANVYNPAELDEKLTALGCTVLGERPEATEANGVQKNLRALTAKKKTERLMKMKGWLMGVAP